MDDVGWMTAYLEPTTFAQAKDWLGKTRAALTATQVERDWLFADLIAEQQRTRELREALAEIAGWDEWESAPIARRALERSDAKARASE